MDRYHELRLGSFDHYLDVALRCVTRNVNQAAFFFDNVGTAFVKITDKTTDILFVTRNNSCGKHDGVAFLDLHSLVGSGRKIPKCRTHLALRTSHQITYLVVVEPSRRTKFDHRAMPDLEQTHVGSDLNILLHRPPKHADLPPVFRRNVKDYLQTV